MPGSDSVFPQSIRPATKSSATVGLRDTHVLAQYYVPFAHSIAEWRREYKHDRRYFNLHRFVASSNAETSNPIPILPLDNVNGVMPEATNHNRVF